MNVEQMSLWSREQDFVAAAERRKEDPSEKCIYVSRDKNKSHVTKKQNTALEEGELGCVGTSVPLSFTF